MELLAFLIVIGLILGFCLGVAGFFMAQTAGHKITSLQQQLKRLAVELNDTRALSLKLYESYRPGEQSSIAPVIAERHAVEIEPEQSTAQQEADEPAIDQRAPEDATATDKPTEEEKITDMPADL